MKKLLIIALGLAAVSAYAQEVDPLDRDQSKYATYSFSKDDQYTVETPYETVTVKQPRGKKIKNVIFMIGDGTGLTQWNVGWVANGGALNVDQMPVAGYSRTYCTDKLITDSCAGGTALAIGEKTKYGISASMKRASP
ncbi:MAG: alkaline phosphatase [Bacteroidales bacterium]|nr:alkaline phosphatase [Bacteroidales bacterium]